MSGKGCKILTTKDNDNIAMGYVYVSTLEMDFLFNLNIKPGTACEILHSIIFCQ